jgi:hypothetical protein
MEMRGYVFAAALAASLLSCGSETAPPAAAPQKAEAPKPEDESRFLPKTGLVESHVVSTPLLGKSFMPGGTVGHYKVGKQEFDMFVAKLPSAQDAAFLLPDWSKALANSTLVPSFGGYFGDDGGKPVFVFPKGVWIAGVVGLPQKDADTQARSLAGMLR